MTIIPQKTCSKCRETKPVTDFARSNITSDGHYPSCKACKSLVESARRAASPDRVKEQKRASYLKHRDKRLEADRRYYAENRERVLERTARYQREHPEVQQKASAKYKATNRERILPKVRERSARWRAQNRDKDRAAALRWQKTNPDAYRANQHRYRTQKKGNGGSYTAAEWQELKARYDHRCLCCGRQEPEIVLTVDHVVPVARGGSSDIANIQPLCLSCNCSKQDRVIDYRI